MPIIPQDDVLKFLMWACGILGTGLIGALVWIAMGVMAKLNKMSTSAEFQYKAFGQQLTSVKDLLTEDIHRHDVRIVRLEEWRKATDKHPFGSE